MKNNERTTDELIGRAVLKIRWLIDNTNKILPMFASSDITLRFETADEVKAISKKLNLIIHEPSNLINHTWCLLKNGPVQVYIQTHEEEKEGVNTKKETKINDN